MLMKSFVLVDKSGTVYGVIYSLSRFQEGKDRGIDIGVMAACRNE